MMQLDRDEARVLGVLVEKAQTTPQQYPLTLNALVNGCNQKNNRDPLTSLSEDRVMAALDSMRGKKLVREVMLTGSRVAKFKHDARDALGLSTHELVVLTELLLRGPQTIGELRGRAARMHPLESLEIVQNVLASMRDREEPLVREIAPAPGSRANRWMQLLAPDAHPVDARGAAPRQSAAASSSGSDDSQDDRLSEIEAAIADLQQQVAELQRELGVPQGIHTAAD